MSDTFLRGFSYIAAFLGVMSVFGVLAFHFPEYLTTPRLRELYDVSQVRLLLLLGLLVSTLVGLIALLFGGIKRYALLGMCCTLLAWIGGGPNVSIEGPVRTSSFYISVDWLLLDLILIATLFISIERVARLKQDQPVLREGWRVDLTHYVVNHPANGGLIYLISLPANTARDTLDMNHRSAAH
jgi:hypothetical protein